MFTIDMKREREDREKVRECVYHRCEKRERENHRCAGKERKR